MAAGLMPPAPPGGPMPAGPGDPAPGGPMPGAPMAPSPMQAPPKVTIEDVVELLRNDRLRGFRIDVETDQLVEADQDAETARRMQFVKEVGALITGALQVEQSPAAPALMPAIGETVMFAVRGYRVGRQLEEVFETAFAKAAWLMEQPKPDKPDPKLQASMAVEGVKLQSAQVKAQAESQKAQIGVAAVQMKAQADQQKIGMEQQRHASEVAREERMADLEQQLAVMDAQLRQAEHAMEMQKMQFEAQLASAAADRDQQAAIEQQLAGSGGLRAPAAPMEGY